MNSSVQRKFTIGIIFGFLIYAAFALFSDVSKLLAIGKEFPWLVVPVVSLLALVTWRTSTENVETAAAFWHMVDLIWILLYPLLYLLR